MNQNSTIDEAAADYDNRGAMIYIVIVLLWYSVGIIFMLAMQMKARSEIIEEAARRRTKMLIQDLRKHRNTKEVLEELVDKERRARLWKIYLGSEDQANDKLNTEETTRIRDIERQLASMKRERRLTNATLFPQEAVTLFSRNRTGPRQINPDLPTIGEYSSQRRRSSFDQQSIERWKFLENQSKSSDQMSWNGRKLLIRKYFRRRTKRPTSTMHQDSNTTTDSLLLFTNQINQLTQRRPEIDLGEVSTSDERQNPYLTYFYKPTNPHPSILSTQFFPASSEPSLS